MKQAASPQSAFPLDEALSTSDAGVETKCAIEFDEYVVLPASRTLLRRGEQVDIGGRAFDLLVLLLAFRGEVVSKESIMRHVWPTTTVDESNLRFQMAVLRKALGEGRALIKTVAGRGYLLAGENGTASQGSLRDLPVPKWTRPSATDGQRAICNAMGALLSALDRHPYAIASFEAMLTAGLHDPYQGDADPGGPT